MANVCLGLGSNASPEENLKLAIDELQKHYGELQISAVYRSTAVGFDGADFLNLVVGLRSEDAPLAICNEIERIHNLAGRDRGSGGYGESYDITQQGLGHSAASGSSCSSRFQSSARCSFSESIGYRTN